MVDALENIPEPPKIRVVVRKRPLTQREGQAQDIVDVEGVGGLSVKEIKYVILLIKIEIFFCRVERPSYLLTSLFRCSNLNTSTL